ncbi:MAG TPA: universal stress protein [Candidatus Acidoferrum sp.]|nr:universal stress protein [Candidatus Acidoferrum sp.]
MKAATAKSAIGFRNILFATDFSAAAANAIPYVKRIAKYYEANLLALHVHPPMVNPLTPPEAWAAEAATAEARDQEHREELFHTFNGIPTQVWIEEGNIVSNLEKAIEKNNIDLVVIGTRGRTGLGKLLLGSVAEEILRTLKCPVMTVGPYADLVRGSDGQIREILYATDFASETQTAAAYAVSLAQEFQARLVLLHVIPKLEAGDLVMASDVVASSRAMLEKLVPAEAGDGCKPKYYVEQGNPAEKILEMAQLREPDLIILGVRPEQGVPGAATHLPISTAHKVVSHATCPVLTVRS